MGLFNVTPANAAYWHSEDFKTITLFNANKVSDYFYQYVFLVPNNALLALYDHLSALNHVDVVHTESYDGYSFTWHYQLDASQIISDRLDALIDQLAGLQSTINNSYGYLAGTVPGQPYPYLSHVELSSALLDANDNPSSLEEFRSRLSVARISSGIFTILTLTLTLFFVSLLNALLVDRQAESIALLRSRGASRLQVFGTFLLQSIGLEIIALAIGLPLATCTVLFLVQHMLPATDALNSITSQPVQATLGTIWYALAVALAALLTLGVSLFFAARMDIGSLRQDTTAATTDLSGSVSTSMCWRGWCPGWLWHHALRDEYQHIITGRCPGTTRDPSIDHGPFLPYDWLPAFVPPYFSFALNIGSAPGRAAEGSDCTLAFAHIARSPRLSLRMSMLLALATAFTLFTLVFSATQAQHIQDIVTNSTGADFSATYL